MVLNHRHWQVRVGVHMYIYTWACRYQMTMNELSRNLYHIYLPFFLPAKLSKGSRLMIVFWHQNNAHVSFSDVKTTRTSRWRNTRYCGVFRVNRQGVLIYTKFLRVYLLFILVIYIFLLIYNFGRPIRKLFAQIPKRFRDNHGTHRTE